MIKILMCVDQPRGEENGYTELTWEGYLDMAATSYWTHVLAALKYVADSSERMSLAAHLAITVSRCQRRHRVLSSGIPQEALYWTHLDFIVKEERL